MPANLNMLQPEDSRTQGGRSTLRHPARHLRQGVFIAIERSSRLGACSTSIAALLTLVLSVPANAGDILRGGAPMSMTGASATYGSGPVAVQQARADAKDALARTTRAIQAVKAMQESARKIAAGKNNLGMDPNHPGQQLPNVPNGLRIGGLVPDSGLKSDGIANDVTTWVNALKPVETSSGGKTNVTIKQTGQQALLNWNTFNIGKDTQLIFDQSKGGSDVGTWIAINKIVDPSGVPSQIIGSIKAPGQVYVINGNGIIFGGHSQLNLHTLVASSLPINDNLVRLGLLNNPDQQFLFSGLSIAAGSNGMPAFIPAAANTPTGAYGDVTVQAGAQISTPTSAEHVGGRVALIGSNVTNAGEISTPDGQTILAAGQQVGLVAHDSKDASLRGLDVYVGAGNGTATNAPGGLIDSPRASVVMAAKEVMQLGVIRSTTSVSLNGRIDLLANYNAASSNGAANVAPFLPSASGNTILGPTSVTEITPEWPSDERVIGTQLTLPSQVNIQGQAIHLETNSQLFAPNAHIALNAGIWNLTYPGGNPLDQFLYTGGQIYLDSKASIYAAGSLDVSAPVSENIIDVQLLGAQMSDFALQRYGALRGKTLQVDIRQSGIYNGTAWIGTPVADASGWVGIIKRNVGELTTSGGTVNLNAGESVIMQPGSSINVSGGSINYTGGSVKTSQLLSQGHLVDISQATPDRVYDGVYTGDFTLNHSKYSISETYINPLMGGAHYENGYVFGGDGGTIKIKSPSVALDGKLLGNTISGPRQRTVTPKPSSLSITLEAQDPSTTSYFPYSPTPPSIVFKPDSRLQRADAFGLDSSGHPLALRDDRKNEVILSPDLVGKNGFGNLEVVNKDGNITVPEGVTLDGNAISYSDDKNAVHGGSVSLTGKNIDVEGSIVMPHGSLSFSVFDISPSVVTALTNSQSTTTPPADPTRGQFTLGSTASLSTAGLAVDDRWNLDAASSLPLVTAGGSILINSYSANLKTGSVIDVSGGVAVSSNGKQSYGDAGSIAINAGQDPTILSLLGGKLELGSELKGFSGSKGGALTVTAPLVRIGEGTSDGTTLALSPEFFSQGGFTSFTLNGIGQTKDTAYDPLPAVAIAPGTEIRPVALNTVVSGGRGGVTLSPILAPVGVRSPVSISLNAVGVKNFIGGDLAVRGDLEMGAGSVIETDPKGSVSLKGQTANVLGSIFTPGGTITISGGTDTNNLFLNAPRGLPTVHIGSRAVLSAAGTRLLIPDVTGRHHRTGLVLNGGNIKVSGNIVAENGAVLNVSGASGILDLAPSYIGDSYTAAGTGAIGVNQLTPGSLISGVSVLPTYASQGIIDPVNGSIAGAFTVPVEVESNGGSITLAGGQELFTNATLLGNAGGSSATGGSLTVSSSRYYPAGTHLQDQLPTDVTLSLTQNQIHFQYSGQSAIGSLITDANGNPLASEGHFAANDFNNHGFDTLTLQGALKYSGAVKITAPNSIKLRSDSAKFGTGVVLIADSTQGNSSLNLTAPYVSLGEFQAPGNPGSPSIILPFTKGDNSTAFPLAPTWGAGNLTVNAKELIDIGSVSLQNIGTAAFNVVNGDLRGDGTLDIQGGITIRAGQIYPPTALSFDIFAYDHEGGAGSVTISAGSNRQLPLSAGGSLGIYATNITQGGVLRAPMGSITLGWDGSGSAPVDALAGSAITVTPTTELDLVPKSITSVSAIDPITGEALVIPYGINVNGISWIDPTATNITSTGLPAKTINISGLNLDVQPGATIDIRGGGDLYAYRFVPGLGGNKDILGSQTSFAVVPGYQADFAPYAAYTSLADKGSNTNQLSGDPGLVNSTLHVGDKIYLQAGSGLPEGIYTLLPARYALLSGAYLITPKTGTPVGTVAQADGSYLVSGYRFGNAQTGTPLYGRFEVASQEVVRTRAEYDNYSASISLATVGNKTADSGRLIFGATQSMNLQGTIASRAAAGGRGASVDISSPVDILINTTGADQSFNGLVLSASQLSGIGADSLLIGGVRQSGVDGTTVSVTTGNITVNNAGAPLEGPEIILTANKGLTLAAKADVESTGNRNAGETLLFGKTDSHGQAVAGSGDGVLLRVSGDETAGILRTGVDTQSAQAALANAPTLSIGAGVTLKGAGLTLDSTYATSLDSNAKLIGSTVSLNSGQISLLLDNQSGADLKLTNGKATAGLVLSGEALSTLEARVNSLSLLSYSSLDTYGAGQIGSLDASGNPTLSSLQLHTAEIRGFNLADGDQVAFSAKNILIDNSSSASVPASVDGATGNLAGTLQFNAETLTLGANQLRADQYSNVVLNTSGGIFFQGAGGFSTQGSLNLIAPLITGVKAASQTISAAGELTLNEPGQVSSISITPGLGASLALSGASIADNAQIVLPSGSVSLHATTGDLQIGSAGRVDVGGIAQTFFDATKYTSGGSISLVSDKGNVTINDGSTVTVAAQVGGGDAGSLTVSAPLGTFTAGNGTLFAQGGAGSRNGTFTLDVGSMPTLDSLSPTLDTAGFSQGQNIRVRTGDVLVGENIKTHSFNLAADGGSITVSGNIDASGQTGGSITLQARDNLVLQSNASLSVVGDYYDNAGKGGQVTLEAGADVNGSFAAATLNGNGTFSGKGYIDIQTGSSIDLSVNHQLTTSDLTLGNSTSNRTDLFLGTLHLRAPITSNGVDVQVNPINGSIVNASSIQVEGYKLVDLTSSGGAITSTVQTNLKNSAVAFLGSAGATTGHYTTMQNRLFANNNGLKSIGVLEPGFEIINRTGDLTLSSDWDFSNYRFGPNRAPGVLTLRAAGNINLNGSLSDGFTNSTYTATLLAANPLLPANTQSWSYRLTAGSDLSGANFRAVKPLSSLGANSGSLLLGKYNGTNTSVPGGENASIATAIAGHYQVIRTGAGDIDIATGRDVQLLNEFASIYTVGSQAPTLDNFDLPQLFSDNIGLFDLYPAQYSLGGGNVNIAAQGNILHLTKDNFGNVIEDSGRELPMNWLYRRGYVDASGHFGTSIWNEVASTTWWVDFSNFFQGVGALGGGNVTMNAGGDIRNVDAVVPTNARMPGYDSGGNPVVPDASNLLELGGGDLSVTAGNNVSGGVYYVERGKGKISAGNTITTNSTRAPYPTNLYSTNDSYPSSTWLPTTLFVGKASFDLSARNDLLLGPAVNPFLQPSGLGNTYWYKTYFTTYAPSDAISASSLTGNVTVRESIVAPNTGSPVPVLQRWMQFASYYSLSEESAAFYQPWLRLTENSLTPFTTTLSLLPPTMRVTAFSGDINLVGDVTLFPSANGTVDLTARGSINALQIVGANAGLNVWSTATLNLSDANPESIPSAEAPFALQSLIGLNTDSAQGTDIALLDSRINQLFKESGATDLVLQDKQALHAPGVLHAQDAVPANLYAANGDISGLTFYSSKAAKILAGDTITDIALYLQNTSNSDVSLISSGGDLIAYDPSSLLRSLALGIGNKLSSQAPLAGDIQISGPGTLEVFAGGNLDLGVGPQNSNGTKLGMTSVGNARNPYLPFAGADIVAAAGVPALKGLPESELNFDGFINQFLTGGASGTGHDYFAELSLWMGTAADLPTSLADLEKLTPEQKDLLALNLFFLVLRDSGRDHNLLGTPGFGTYAAGLAAIQTLFGGVHSQGDISLTSREIKTKSGGNISLFAPAGGLNVGFDVAGSQAADQGILTEDGGNISIFTNDSVTVGTSRIFTLRGGNEIIWSTVGSIAAGASSKTVQSAPPTRVIIDPQSADVKTDLAGLATGGGIGVLATVTGVAPGDVDLIAPVGTIDAGDAGIRVSGNINIAAAVVVNASNIQAAGSSSGVPAPSVNPPSLSSGAPSTANAAANNAAEEATKQQTRAQQSQQEEAPSIITVEVIGYGGGDSPAPESNSFPDPSPTPSPTPEDKGA